MKYYAVRTGRQTGIFTSWEQCKQSVSSFSGAAYKSFASLADAEAFLAGTVTNTASHADTGFNPDIQADLADGYIVSFCDGSFSDSAQAYAFGVIIIDLEGQEHTFNGTDNTPMFLSARNVSGEVFGALCSMVWAFSKGYKKLKIYHDYEGISKWITGEWQASSPIARTYLSLYQTQYSKSLVVEFKKVKGHSNVYYNEKVDALAKSAFIGRPT